MNFRNLGRNILTAFMAQGVAMLVSIIISIVVPKLLGVEEFGYWQLFIFYAGYAGFFLLGLNDGIYLIEGGHSRIEINKSSISSQFILGLVSQFVVGLLIALVSVCTAPSADRAFVLVAFAVYIPINNLTGFLGYVFQAVNETKLFSLSTIIDRVSFLIPLLIMTILRIPDFRWYVIAYCIARAIALIWCCWHAKEFIFAAPEKLSDSVSLCLTSIKVGIKLMIANIADMLVLGVARGLVDMAWGIESFGRVSFALSIVNFFITFVTQASMVLFPALRMSNKQELQSVYKGLRDASEILFPAVYLLYFPMVCILSSWLPQYVESMRYFAILLPVCVFNTKMDICCTTYFKVLRNEGTLLVINVITVIASAAVSLFGVYVLKSLDAVLLGASVCIAARSAWSEHRIDSQMKVLPSPMRYTELFITVAFICLSLSLDVTCASLIYLLCYIAYIVFYKSELVSLCNRIRSVLH